VLRREAGVINDSGLWEADSRRTVMMEEGRFGSNGGGEETEGRKNDGVWDRKGEFGCGEETSIGVREREGGGGVVETGGTAGAVETGKRIRSVAGTSTDGSVIEGSSQLKGSAAELSLDGASSGRVPLFNAW
jgi:hypothetical protein